MVVVGSRKRWWVAYNSPIGNIYIYTTYIPLIYCLLESYVLPTTFSYLWKPETAIEQNNKTVLLVYTWRIIPGAEWLGSPPFTSHEVRPDHLERELTITMVNEPLPNWDDPPSNTLRIQICPKTSRISPKKSYDHQSSVSILRDRGWNASHAVNTKGLEFRRHDSRDNWVYP